MDKESEKAIYEEISKLSTESLKKKLLMLDSLNKEKLKLEESGYEKEYNVLKEGFDSKYRDIYDEISKIVKGDVFPEVSGEEKTKYEITDNTNSEKGIADYFSVALKNSAYFPQNTKDDEILKHLVDIRLKQDSANANNSQNFIVEFEFTPNEYFTPNLLTKTYIYDKETDEVEKTVGCQIEWTSKDKNPRIEVKTKKVKKGKKVETKTVESVVPSFFDMFADTEKDDPIAIDEANFWKDDFFSNSLEYYLNIIDSEVFGAGEDMEDEEDEDEDDDEGDKKRRKSKGDKKPAGGADKEKCKNQ